MTEVKYHINLEGIPDICRAKGDNCPFGGSNFHFATEEEARRFEDERQFLLSNIKNMDVKDMEEVPTQIVLGADSLVEMKMAEEQEFITRENEIFRSAFPKVEDYEYFTKLYFLEDDYNYAKASILKNSRQKATIAEYEAHMNKRGEKERYELYKTLKRRVDIAKDNFFIYADRKEFLDSEIAIRQYEGDNNLIFDRNPVQNLQPGSVLIDPNNGEIKNLAYRDKSGRMYRIKAINEMPTKDKMSIGDENIVFKIETTPTREIYTSNPKKERYHIGQATAPNNWVPLKTRTAYLYLYDDFY